MRRLLGLLCLSALAIGCAAESTTSKARRASGSGAASGGDSAGAASEAGAVSRTSWNTTDSSAGKSPKNGDTTPRIIYTADVELVADDFDSVREQLTQLIEKSDGYVASTSMDRSEGRHRTGQWVARVPVGQFEGFLAALDKLGVVESRDITSEDVTMEYVDVASRIENLKRLEERFVELLEKDTGKLEDVLKVEQELARVRGDIEQAQGRMRYLTNRTDYSTVTINVREQRNYVPPESPALTNRIADVWFNSLDVLSAAGVAIVLAAVAVTPWVIVFGIVLALLYVLLRLALRRRRSSAPR